MAADCSRRIYNGAHKAQFPDLTVANTHAQNNLRFGDHGHFRSKMGIAHISEFKKVGLPSNLCMGY